MGASGDVGDRRPDAAGRARRLGTPGRTTGQQTRTRPRAVTAVARRRSAEPERGLSVAVETRRRRRMGTSARPGARRRRPAPARHPQRRPRTAPPAPGSETVTELCQGTTGSAERIRRAAQSTGPDAAWSPLLSAESLSQSATCATVISYHCQILLHTLATRASDHGSSRLSRALEASADAASQARAAWLAMARTWYQTRTDARGAISPAAAEAADLAVWTGRLAYASPHWTLNLGPAHPARAPQELSPEPADIGIVLSAVHQATTTLTALAVADYTQV